jgi:hypothetical protein
MKNDFTHSAEALTNTLRVIGDLHRRNPDMQLTIDDVQRIGTIGRKMPEHAHQAIRVLHEIAHAQSGLSVSPDKNIYDRLNRASVSRTAVNCIEQIARVNPNAAQSALHALTSLLAERPDNLWIGLTAIGAMREAMRKNKSCDESIIGMLDRLSKAQLESDRLGSVLELTVQIAERNGGQIAIKAVEILSRHTGFGPVPATGKSPLFHIAELGRNFAACEKPAMKTLIAESGHAERRDEACREIAKSYACLRESFDAAVNPAPAQAPLPVLNSKKPAPPKPA